MGNACDGSLWPLLILRFLRKVLEPNELGLGQVNPWPFFRDCGWQGNIAVPSSVPIHLCLDSMQQLRASKDMDELKGSFANFFHALAQEIFTNFPAREHPWLFSRASDSFPRLRLNLSRRSLSHGSLVLLQGLSCWCLWDARLEPND